LTQDGIDALLRVSKGDMRRILNIMQTCFTTFKCINEYAVYQITGQPSPQQIQEILNMTSMNSYLNLEKYLIENGLALNDIITSIYEYISQLDLPTKSRIYLLDHLSNIEYRLANGCHTSIQLMTLLGHLTLATQQK
jgi:replication factor C subunit 3/5